MPVLVKQPSEYQINYQWHDSRKSKSYAPPLEALKPAAGVKSELAAKTSEPAITSKKKVISSSATATTKFEIGQGDDEYMLLGNTDKFAQNVQYRAKSRDRAMNLLKKSQPVENGNDVTSPPQAPRQQAPAPKVKYDPGAPALRPKKSDIEPTAIKSKAVEVQNGRPVPEKSALKQSKKPNPKSKHHEPVISKSEPEKKKFEPVLKLKNADDGKIQQKATIKKDRRESRKGHMHESVQADMDKGISYSQQEAPADYAMKYRAGIPPPRSKGPKRLSEYAMAFQWKKGFPSSPMIAAEQMVYKSNPQAPPFHPDSMAKASEYKKQFQPWHLLKSTPNLALAVREEEEESIQNGHVPVKKSRKHKRSKSLEDVSPDARPPAGGDTYVSSDDKRMIKESLNPQKLHFPHGKFKSSKSKVNEMMLLSAYKPEKQTPVIKAKRETVKYLLYQQDRVTQKMRSEYESNFAPPQKFDFTDGAWRGADPPHIAQRVGESSSITGDVAASATWFQEVMELRKRAQEYKKRALGTHFSREHTGQLYSKNAEVWDTVSDAGESIVSALSLESPASQRSRASKASSRKERKSRKSAWKEEMSDAPETPSSGVYTPASERTLTPNGSIDGYGYDEDDDVSVSTYTSDVATPKVKQHQQQKQAAAGRIPTPKLKQQIVQKKVTKNRHHLDRTTPATHVRESFSAPAMIPAQNKPSAYGKPTEDSHVLVDEDAASDHTLNLNFVKTLPQTEKEKEEFKTRLSTIKEASGEYKSTTKSGPVPQLQLSVDDIPIRPPTEDDCLSVSARSIASSCSFASEVLERAKRRNDGFWSDSKK